ncbi:Alpha/Beta hydrolase protein [Aspergillus aurantiobrunneus]
MTLFPDSLFLAFIAVLIQLRGGLTAAHVVPLEVTKEPERQISPHLFDTLGELARVVDIAYCIGTTGVQKPFQCLSHCRELQGFELINTWHTGPFLSDSCGYIAVSHPPSPKRIIIAFRGTYSISNTIVDLSVLPQEYVPFPVGNDTNEKCAHCFVHSGFMKAWQSARTTILDTIFAAREQYPDYTLTLVGHSLGGAVAALAGTEMQLRGWDPIVTTFGEPRVGNKAFVEYLDEVFHLDAHNSKEWKFRRVTHVNDPVPLVPPREWGYEMHSGEIYISRVGLPFSLDDVKYCKGRSDKECISGAEGVETTSSSDHLYGINAGLDVEQQVISNPSSSSSLSGEDETKEEKASLLPELQVPSRSLWHLLPLRFRLWELFYSHRDYFLRLGLCVPGGDPSGRW